MKIPTICATMLTAALLLLGCDDSKESQQNELDFKDDYVRRTASFEQYQQYVVTRVLTNYDGVTLIRVTSNNGNADCGRYAISLVPDLTNGTKVRLINIYHANSVTTVYDGSLGHNTTIAVR